MAFTRERSFGFAPYRESLASIEAAVRFFYGGSQGDATAAAGCEASDQAGRPRVDYRAALNGILFVLHTRIPWEDLHKKTRLQQRHDVLASPARLAGGVWERRPSRQIRIAGDGTPAEPEPSPAASIRNAVSRTKNGSSPCPSCAACHGTVMAKRNLHRLSGYQWGKMRESLDLRSA